MPRLKADIYRPWKVGGRTVGYRRSGVYWIDRTIAGRRLRFSTTCVTRAGALVELRKFEMGPAAYVSPRGKPAVGSIDPVRVAQGRENHLRRQYRITPEEYGLLLARQNGRCAICGALPISGPRGRLDVDHCHRTGLVRGLLCNACNRGIGCLGESAEVLRRAAAYLERADNVTSARNQADGGGPDQAVTA